MRSNESGSDENKPKAIIRRRMRNYLIRPKVQIGYAGIFTIIAFVSGIVTGMPLIFALQSIAPKISQEAMVSPEAAEFMTNTIGTAAAVAIFNLVVLVFIAFNLGVLVTHRIFGALHRLEGTVEQLKHGDYSARVRLRTTDQVLDLGERINELAVILESKKQG